MPDHRRPTSPRGKQMDLLSGFFMPLKSPCSPPSAHLQPNHRPQPLDVLPDFSQLHLNPPVFSPAIPKSLPARFSLRHRRSHPRQIRLIPAFVQPFPVSQPPPDRLSECSVEVVGSSWVQAFESSFRGASDRESRESEAGIPRQGHSRNVCRRR